MSTKPHQAIEDLAWHLKACVIDNDTDAAHDSAAYIQSGLADPEYKAVFDGLLPGLSDAFERQGLDALGQFSEEQILLLQLRTSPTGCAESPATSA